jgi:outer membrane lipoprotein-sorting protein
MYRLLLLIYLVIPAYAYAAEDPAQLDAEAILQQADAVRNPQLDYAVIVDIESHQPSGMVKKGQYEVLVKGRDNTLVKTLEPARERGRIILMRGKDLWAYIPNVSKPLRISLRERLMGEVANGDIARTNFSGDYTPMVSAIIQEADKELMVLDLMANAKDVTYAKVRLWVENKTYHPVRAELYALSGKLLKYCRYEAYQKMEGRLRPTRMVLEDPTIPGKFSILTYTNMEIREIPEKVFTKQYLNKL